MGVWKMKKVMGKVALVAGLIGGLVFGAFLNDSMIKVAQKDEGKVAIRVLDKDGNSLTGLAGVIKDRSV
jgi:hypothetical protein